MLPNLFINGYSYLLGDGAMEDFAPFVDARKLRRAEQISKNVLLCAFRALEQAQRNMSDRAEWGISLAMGAGAVGSTLKFMDSIVTDGDELSSPTAFASSVHNSTALFLSMFLGIKGPCVVMGQLDASFAGALLTAQQFLAKQMCGQVLVVVAEDVNPFLAEMLQKNPHCFDPFVYQAHLPPTRVAGAFVVSATPTSASSFVLEKIALCAVQDVETQSQPLLPVHSCAHSMLLLTQQLEKKTAFAVREQFAGMIFEVAGKPYV